MFTGKKYLWLTRATLILPTLIVLAVMFIKGNNGVKLILEAPKIKVNNAGKNYDFIKDEDNYLLYLSDPGVILITDFDLEYNDIKIDGTLAIDDDSFFKLNEKYYIINQETKKLEVFDHYKLIQDNLVKKGLSLSLNFIIGIPSILLVIFMVSKKMDWVRRHRRLSLLIALALTTSVLLVINLIITSMFEIFLTITLSVAVYYLEWVAMRKKAGLPLTDEIPKKVENV